MIGKTILHYHGSSRIRLLPDKIIEKLPSTTLRTSGEGGMGVVYKTEDIKNQERSYD